MLKRAPLYIVFILGLGSCTSLKTAFTGKKPGEQTQPPVAEKKETKFIEEISVPVQKADVVQEKQVIPEKIAAEAPPVIYTEPVREQESISNLQIKYAALLNTPAEEVKNLKMYEFIDDWYGTPYRYGGTTKKGIDCSAFSQYLFAAVYTISLPRTARDQYKLTNRISRTELKEGDLIFFNTRGGVSHVGVYLQNNKFVHASTSGGVMISDIFDNYWVRRFIGVGRLKNELAVASGQ